MWTAKSGQRRQQALKRVLCVPRGRRRQCQSQRYHFSDRRGRCKSCATSSDSATKNLYKCTRISLTRAALAFAGCIPAGDACRQRRVRGTACAHTYACTPREVRTDNGATKPTFLGGQRNGTWSDATRHRASRRRAGRKCARRGWRTTYAYVGVRALFAAAAARCKWHVVNFAAGRRTVDSGLRTLDVEFVVLTPAAAVPEFQRCHRGAKRCCIAAAANVTPDSGQNCAGHCWLTTNTNTMLHTVADTHTTAQTQSVTPVLRASA